MMSAPEPAKRHLAIIANSAAGRGRKRLDKMFAYLLDHDVTTELVVPNTPQGTREAVAAAAEKHEPVIVVAGGDGTISTALPTLIEQQLPLVVIPTGTGNDLAGALGISLNQPGQGVAAALSGHERTIDTGVVFAGEAETPFVTVVALGFDAQVAARTDRLRWPRGGARYYLALVIELARLKPIQFRVRIDDGEWEDAPGSIIAVANTSSYGGGMPIAPNAQPDDGLLDYVHAKPLGRLQLLRLFPSLLRGTHLGRKEASHRTIRSIEVQAPGLVAYADGEPVAHEECRIEIRPGTLRVLTCD